MEKDKIIVRWMRMSDLTRVKEIVSSCRKPLIEKDLEKLLAKSGLISVVATYNEEAIGFLIYDSVKISKIKIVHLVVDDFHKRFGIGRKLIIFMISKLNDEKNKIEINVSEYNVAAQLFLKAMGFKVVSTISITENISEYKFLYKNK